MIHEVTQAANRARAAANRAAANRSAAIVNC